MVNSPYSYKEHPELYDVFVDGFGKRVPVLKCGSDLRRAKDKQPRILAKEEAKPSQYAKLKTILLSECPECHKRSIYTEQPTMATKFLTNDIVEHPCPKHRGNVQ